MNCIIPFSHDIKFNTNISEILSISLEHDYTLNESELLGNFMISGDYKSHEVSVNKDHFEHVLPFSVSLTDRIAPDSLEFNIEDFTYEVLNNNTLKVDIEYSIKGDTVKEEPVIFERFDEKEEPTIEELLENVEEEVEDVEEKKEEKEIREEVLEEIEETPLEKEVEEKSVVEENITPKEVIEEREEQAQLVTEQMQIEETTSINEEEKETILSTVSEEDNAFVTYHIHVLKEQETIETVCSLYSTTGQTLSEYNDLENLTVGSKIIIPEESE